MEHLQEALLKWYGKNQRDLPWRNTKNPYKIWLSEIILQQTKVDQGLPYYLHFIQKYPNVKALAIAKEQEIMKSWEGLGYYSRARNLHASAKFIHQELKDVFPDTYNSIIQLKGIGPYTAAAIASFAFNEPKAVVDGNVYRVLSRLFLIQLPIDSTTGQKTFQELANNFLNIQSPANHNQAIMELGAMVCTPKHPNCNACPFENHCPSKDEQWQFLPVKSKKIKTKNRHFDFFVYRNEDKILIEQRTAKDIWQNLYQFPMIESNKHISQTQLNKRLRDGEQLLDQSAVYKHILTHQKIYAKFHWIETNSTIKRTENQEWIPISKLKKYAFPKLILNYLESMGI